MNNDNVYCETCTFYPYKDYCNLFDEITTAGDSCPFHLEKGGLEYD